MKIIIRKSELPAAVAFPVNAHISCLDDAFVVIDVKAAADQKAMLNAIKAAKSKERAAPRVAINVNDMSSTVLPR